jgi:hypothetical protein
LLKPQFMWVPWKSLLLKPQVMWRRNWDSSRNCRSFCIFRLVWNSGSYMTHVMLLSFWEFHENRLIAGRIILWASIQLHLHVCCCDTNVTF